MVFNENGKIINEGFFDKFKNKSKNIQKDVTIDIIPFKSVGNVKFGSKSSTIKYDDTKNFMVWYDDDKVDRIQIRKESRVDFNLEGVGIIDFDNLKDMINKLQPLSFVAMNNYYVSKKYGLLIYPDQSGEKIRFIQILSKMN